MKNPKSSLTNALTSNRHMMLIIIIAIVGIVFQGMTDGLFLSSRNLGTLFLQFSTLGYLTIGCVFVMITRGIDLSIDSVIGLVAATGAVTNILHDVNPFAVILIMLLMSMLTAGIQGGIVAYVGVPAFVVTLAGQMSLKGASLLISGGQERAPLDEKLSAIATTWLPSGIVIAVILVLDVVLCFYIVRSFLKNRAVYPEIRIISLISSLAPVILISALLIYVSVFKGLPFMFIVLAVWAVISHVILEYTPLGRQIYAVGANPEAARLNGIDPRKITFICFLLMGVAYFLGSVGSMARITGYSPTIGTGMDMDAIAAAVIGGTSTMGGYGTALGAVLGAILLTSIDNGMVLMNVSTFWQYVIKGIILLVAVVIDVKTKKHE